MSHSGCARKKASGRVEDQQARAKAYGHVLWIGGSPCAGKTSIADALAAAHHGVAYHFDRMEMAHIARSTEATNPDLMAFLALDMEHRWLLRTPEEMARNAIASWRARFPLVLEDLRALPTDAPIFAEGPGLFPERVAPLLASPRQALWLVTTSSFCQMVRQQRGGSFLETSDPAGSLRNIVERDMVMARLVKRQAKARHLTCYAVDGSQSLAQMTALVEEHFAPYLSAG
jgi:hypothetical protein